MKKFYIILIALLLGSGAMAQTARPCKSCLSEGKIFKTQAEIDNFQTNYPDCTVIDGNVTIQGDSDIKNLNGFSVLTSIKGYLDIIGNSALTSLTGLDNLTSIGGYLKIERDSALTSLTGLDNLTKVTRELKIFVNPALTSLTGLDNLTYVGDYLRIDYNEALTSLTGLENLTSIGGYLNIYHNSALTNLTGLENLTSMNRRLTIDQNIALTSLAGLENIEAGKIKAIQITRNSSLSDCAVQSICDYLAAPGADVYIDGNATGCNSKTEVEDACANSSVYELNTQSLLSFFPNPASNAITIKSANNGMPPKNTYLTIFNLNGQKLIQQAIIEPQTVVDVSVFFSGTYFVKVVSNDGMQVGKFVKE